MAGLACSRLTLANVRLRRGAFLSKLPEADIFRSDVTGILDEFATEDEPLLTARANAEQIGGAAPVAALTGAALRFLASAIGAKAVVEIGTGFGTSGIWLLRGMRPGSVLTSVDLEPEHHRLARAAFTAAGFPASRYRLITGRALEVLPRLADSAYDLVFCDADKRESPEYLAAAVRLLRPGGIVAFDNALWTDQGANVVLRDPDTAAIGELRELVRADEGLVPLLLPIGGGLLAAVKRPA
jgi:predicted O-methyltransferase YrrM